MSSSAEDVSLVDSFLQFSITIPPPFLSFSETRPGSICLSPSLPFESMEACVIIGPQVLSISGLLKSRILVSDAS
jgi:hypothetical protein